jgi:hypothetical protein
MSSYVAKEQPEPKRLRFEELRRIRAARADADMVARLQKEQRLHRLDQQLAELNEMQEATTHPKLKELLSRTLSKLGTVREQIAL